MIASKFQIKDPNDKSISNKSNDIIVKPIIYGSVAFWLGKKAEENLSHKWCVYVRGVNNEDISYFIKEVSFTLHSSFNNHIRTVNKFPFELYEVGWGQFDIIITIHLVDHTAKPIEFLHPLKLYPSQPHVSMSTKKPVVSESYDEIIFVNPEPNLKEILLNPPLQKKENPIQIPMNLDDDRKSPEYSLYSQEERGSMMQVEKAEKCQSFPNLNSINLKRDPSFKISATFENKFDNMNLATQMEVTPSQFNIPTSFQQKLEDLNLVSAMGNYKLSNTYMNELDNMNIQNDMIIDSAYNPHKDVNQNADTISMMSNSMDPDKKGEDKRSLYIPNIHQYFLPVDDTGHFKMIDDANKFVIQEIARLKKQLEDTDKDISNVKKNIKGLIQN